MFSGLLDDDETFDIVLARVRHHGVPVVAGIPEEAELRGVDRLVRFPGPNGLAQENFTRMRAAIAPVATAARGGFVTGTAGLGRVAVTTTTPHQVRGYYATAFEARLSDLIDLNVQVAALDDMTNAYQRVNRLAFRMALGVGQHTNDKELSCYAVTPSGFEWELGWGHAHEGQTIIGKLGKFKTGAASLLHGEDVVPALAGAGIPD